MTALLKIFFLFTLLQASPLARTLQTDVEYLSSEVCQGRATGTGGCTEATRYLLLRLGRTGLDAKMQSFGCDKGVGRNVYVESSVKGARGTVVVTASYDGLGTLDAVVYPGADSNASGVAALLSLADSLSASPLKRLDVILVCLDARNCLSAGASAFVRDVLKGRDVRMVVDLDIVGSSLAPYKPYQKDYLLALGGKPYRKTLDELGSRHGLTLYYDYYGSRDFTDLFYSRMGDRPVFLAEGYPLVMFTSGITLHTNKPSDTASTLDYAQMGRRVELVLDYLRTL